MQRLAEEKDSEEPSEAISYGKERADDGSKHEQSKQVLEPMKEEAVVGKAEEAQPGDSTVERRPQDAGLGQEQEAEDEAREERSKDVAKEEAEA